jgi:Domain of Unknown Function (DUF1259)
MAARSHRVGDTRTAQETEINPVMSKMIAGGLDITAVHNHLQLTNDISANVVYRPSDVTLWMYALLRPGVTGVPGSST